MSEKNSYEAAFKFGCRPPASAHRLHHAQNLRQGQRGDGPAAHVFPARPPAGSDCVSTSHAIVLVGLALFWDAPLEQLANPLLTPNPAKAPWYFLGLQELLHYFPPLVAGVLLPTLVVLALVVIPYFDVNIEGEPLWAHRSRRRVQVYIGGFAVNPCFARPLRCLDRPGAHAGGGGARPRSIFQSHGRLRGSRNFWGRGRCRGG